MPPPRLLALPITIYFWKVIVWDKVLGLRRPLKSIRWHRNPNCLLDRDIITVSQAPAGPWDQRRGLDKVLGLGHDVDHRVDAGD